MTRNWLKLLINSTKNMMPIPSLTKREFPEWIGKLLEPRTCKKTALDVVTKKAERL